jgi:DNA topoisomerase-1
MFKRNGRGPLKSYCINEACTNFVPEENRRYKKKAPAEGTEAQETENAGSKPAAKKAATKTTKKTSTKKSAGSKTAKTTKTAAKTKTTTKKPAAKKTAKAKEE